jgi:hypothetical protein
LGAFTFNGVTVIEPCILVRTIIGAQKTLSLLPFGTICFVGASDGGSGFYRFSDLPTAQRVLRAGALLDAIEASISGGGGAAGFVAVIAGTKTASTLLLGGGGAELTSGDLGSWNDGITFTSIAGTTSGNAVTFTYPDPISGTAISLGGPGTAYDNLATLSALRTVMLADAIITPPAATPFPALLTLTITTDGPIGVQATVNLAGGTGNGSYTPLYPDFKAALDSIDEIAFDIGHLVGGYDIASQQYANSKAKAHEVYGYLQRWIHQVRVAGANAGNLVQVNSEEVVNTAIGVAAEMNSYRASVVPQQTLAFDSNLGTYSYVDAAPILCGLAAYIGATDQWGPASPLTHVFLPTCADVDYPVLRTTGDQGRAILGGVMLLETIGAPAAGNVRVVQSITTQPIDPATGLVWALSEFSCVRAADALLANVKATIDTASPRAIGGGNTLGTLNSIIAKVTNIIELAMDASWITGYDPNSISITPTGPTSSDDLITYSVAPPLNHIGVTQTLLPFTASLSGS